MDPFYDDSTVYGKLSLKNVIALQKQMCQTLKHAQSKQFNLIISAILQNQATRKNKTTMCILHYDHKKKKKNVYNWLNKIEQLNITTKV